MDDFAILLSTRHANVVKQALSYWINNAEAKARQIGERALEMGAVHDPQSGWSTTDAMPTSLRADIEHINTMLPLRLEAAREVLQRIQASGRTAAGV